MNKQFNFDNSYINLPKTLYSSIDLKPVKNPQLIIFNDSLSEKLNLNSEFLKSKDGVDILAGNKKAKYGAYIAQAYAGHQFGHFTMLGDGRALLIGEQIDKNGNRFDIQLKGSGRTPYSRNGDGRAVVGPMIREYIVSEAMHALNIPTTRSLAVVSTGEDVIRETIKPGAILTRVSSSHLRFGTFEYASFLCKNGELKKLADYAIDRHYPHLNNAPNKYISFFDEIVKKQAELVAMWQSIGFIHGVLNTDNMSIAGETIDYGPCAFMDTYDPNTVFSSIDTQGRYSYTNQAAMVQWNLCRFAEAILDLFDDDEDKALQIAQNSISKFAKLFSQNLISRMCAKIGIFEPNSSDEAIIAELLDIMKKYEADFTNTFLALTFDKFSDEKIFNSQGFSNWYKKWKSRIEKQNKSQIEIQELMKNSNPAVIPRNHRVEEAIVAAENGDYSVMNKLLEILKTPYAHSNEQEVYKKPPTAKEKVCKTYCGT